MEDRNQRPLATFDWIKPNGKAMEKSWQRARNGSNEWNRARQNCSFGLSWVTTVLVSREPLRPGSRVLHFCVHEVPFEGIEGKLVVALAADYFSIESNAHEDWSCSRVRDGRIVVSFPFAGIHEFCWRFAFVPWVNQASFVEVTKECVSSFGTILQALFF